MFVHSDHVYRYVLGLFGSGRSDYEIARLAGVPRSTVQKWRHQDPTARRGVTAIDTWAVHDALAYCYVLGLYLGDGHIVLRNTKPSFMRFFLDAKYPSVVDEAARALETVFAPAAVHHYDWGAENRIILQVSHQALLIAFPQYGPGKKHDRKIELVDWQRELTEVHPED